MNLIFLVIFFVADLFFILAAPMAYATSIALLRARIDIGLPAFWQLDRFIPDLGVSARILERVKAALKERDAKR